ncbi:MAG: hypothetical protein HY021_15060 [Burkholderiales bacterium]|nr:hypothetical protein [Burkholderiales bacterium]
MAPPLLQIALRLLACVAFTAVVWRWLGFASLVLCAPLFGVLLARPILDLIGQSARTTKQLALQHLEGRYYEHRGIMVDIVEDVERHRWLLLTDVRKLVDGLPSDPVLERLYPADVRSSGSSSAKRIRADTLAMYLEKSTHGDSLKLKIWLEREVAFPARRLRGGRS